jgi:hypothetical protein
MTSIRCDSASRSVGRLIPSACGFKLVAGFVVGVVRRIYIPGRARCGGRGNLNVGACHSVAREAAPTITSVRFDSTGGSVGRLIASARGCERGCELVRALVVGIVRAIDTAWRARCCGAGAVITAALVAYAARVTLPFPGRIERCTIGCTSL